MARCTNHECGHYDPEVAVFMNNTCPKCGMEQLVCESCGDGIYEEACALRKKILKDLNLFVGRFVE